MIRIFTSLLLLAALGHAELIPAARLYTKGWATAGVVGGIPAQNQKIFATIKSTGDATDRSAEIQTALDNCPSGQVVKLGVGTFQISSDLELTNKTGVILRGSGLATILDVRGSGGYGILIGNGGADYPWKDPRGTPLGASEAAGQTVISLPSTTAFTVNDHVLFHQKPDPAIPVIDMDDVSKRGQMFLTTITAKDSSTITIQDPLPFPCTTALDARVKLIMTSGWATSCGIEDLKVDCANGKAATGIRLYNCYNCWLYNVWVNQPTNYNVESIYLLHCEIRYCRLTGQGPTGNNHSGTINGFPGSDAPGAFMTLFVDNIIENAFPCLELNVGSAGNVFAYNACENSTALGGIFGVSIDTNHGSHPNFNLIEGNIAPKLQADGYFGSCSDDTIARNRITGAQTRAQSGDTALSYTIDLCRFTRRYNVVGNVLGMSQAYWTPHRGTLTYEQTANGASGPAIYRFGFPGMGNNQYSGTAEPSKGDPWETAGKSTGSGARGYLERDLDVRNTVILKGNYNLFDGAIPRTEDPAGDAIPASYFLSKKPAWFRNRTFPVVWLKVGGSNADLSSEYEQIPAGYRLVHGTDAPAGDGKATASPAKATPPSKGR